MSMALRYNKLRVERGSPELSRSFPKSGGHHFKSTLQKCVQGTGSLESVSSAGYGNSGKFFFCFAFTTL